MSADAHSHRERRFPPFPLAARARVRRAALHDRDRHRPPSRRGLGGACVAAGIDVDFNLRTVARAYGPELAARVRADLRHLAPDLLRWHLPRIAPDGLLRPGLTLTLARYEGAGYDGSCPVHLVVRTPPAWADSGQRFGLALWDRSRPGPAELRHPRPRPSRRFRLDLHRHLWDARRTGELRGRSGADRPPPSPGGRGVRAGLRRRPLGGGGGAAAARRRRAARRPGHRTARDRAAAAPGPGSGRVRLRGVRAADLGRARGRGRRRAARPARRGDLGAARPGTAAGRSH